MIGVVVTIWPIPRGLISTHVNAANHFASPLSFSVLTVGTENQFPGYPREGYFGQQKENYITL